MMLRYGFKYPAKHSEIDCINNFPYPPGELSKYTMWNTRIDRNGLIKLAKPCKNCQIVLNQFNIDVVYTNHEGEFVNEHWH